MSSVSGQRKREVIVPKNRTSGTKLVLLENNWSHDKYSVDCAISEQDSAEQCSSSISKSMSIVSEVSNSQSAESFHWEEKMVKAGIAPNCTIIEQEKESSPEPGEESVSPVGDEKGKVLPKIEVELVNAEKMPTNCKEFSENTPKSIQVFAVKSA